MYKYDFINQEYLYNCYKINSNETKSFYFPENLNETSSCYELYGKYIIENTNECIDLPQENSQNINYFVSNNKTGLLSPCDSSCLSCSQKPTVFNSNCDSCKNNFLQDGNCVTRCQDGYYEKNQKCFKCHSNCQTCESGILTNNKGQLTNMKCTKCKENIQLTNSLRNLESTYILKMIKNDENCFPIIIYIIQQ